MNLTVVGLASLLTSAARRLLSEIQTRDILNQEGKMF